MSTIAFTLSLSLFDSLSTAQQIIIFALLLTTLRPLRNSLSFLAGLSGAYFACGVAGFLAIGQLRAFIDRYVPSSSRMPDAAYYRTEFVIGLVMALIGLWYYRRNRHAPPDRMQNLFVARFKTMSGWFSLMMGAFISASSFPVSIPYLIALERYSALHQGFTAACMSILLYNFGYALPMIAVLLVYLYARGRIDDLSDALHEKTRVLNVHLTTWAWSGVGVFSMVDSSCYFLFGRALIKGRFF
jgi:cytochrome c biogenesis protein CcdA